MFTSFLKNRSQYPESSVVGAGVYQRWLTIRIGPLAINGVKATLYSETSLVLTIETLLILTSIKRETDR